MKKSARLPVIHRRAGLRPIRRRMTGQQQVNRAMRLAAREGVRAKARGVERAATDPRVMRAVGRLLATMRRTRVARAAGR